MYFVIYREGGIGEAKLVPETVEDMGRARTIAEKVLTEDPRRTAYIVKAQEAVKTEMSILFRVV